MELFAFFVGGGQTRKTQKIVTTRETRCFHIQKTKSKIILSAQAFYEVERIFFSQSQRGGGGTCMVLLFK